MNETVRGLILMRKVYLQTMKWIKLLLMVLALICFFEVYYLYTQLSFIDTPYLYGGMVLGLVAFGLHIGKSKK